MKNKFLCSFGVILILIGALLSLTNFKSFSDPWKEPLKVDEYKNESNGVTTIFHIEKLRTSPLWGVAIAVLGFLTIIFVRYGFKK
jgi:hypothetical protein